MRTSLLLVAKHVDALEEEGSPFRPDLPAANLNLLVRRGTNPRKQRKGKSGEVARRGGK